MVWQELFSLRAGCALVALNRVYCVVRAFALLCRRSIERSSRSFLATLSTGFGPSFAVMLPTPVMRWPSDATIRVQEARLEPCSQTASTTLALLWLTTVQCCASPSVHKEAASLGVQLVLPT